MNKAPKEVIDLANRLTLKGPNLSVIPDTEDYPWFVREFQKELQLSESKKKLLLPNLKDNNESIGIFTDYGGESADSKYLTYSFLVCAWNQTGVFHDEMGKLRKEYGLNEPFKEIAFKDFRYGPIKRALDNYLMNLSNWVNGYLLTVVVEKYVGSIFGENKKVAQKFIQQTLKNNDLGSWKPEVAEKLLRVLHFSAYLVALLSKEKQKVFWMTDHDAIAPTDCRFNKTLTLFSNFLKLYCPHELSKIGGATPFEEESPQFLDLLSAPDIVSGSIEHYLTRSYGKNEEPLIKTEADKVLCWLSHQGVALKHHTMMIRTEEDGLVCGTLRFKLKRQNPEAIFVPVSTL